MIVIGLTGSMAMGKSTAAKMLADMSHVAVHDSDAAVAALYNRPEIIDLIKTTFPASYDRKTKKIDKKKLREELANDHEKWDALEEILHPYVRSAQQKFLQEQQRLGTKIAVLDIPLLFETEAEKRLDYTICVSAPDFIQRQRIEERIRNGLLTAEDAEFRLERQMPDSEKRARADFVVSTGQGLAPMRRDLEKIVKLIKDKHWGNGNEGNRFPPHNM